MQWFDVDRRDVVEREKSDTVASAFDLGLGFHKYVAAGATPVCAFGAEEHGDGAEVGGEVVGGMGLFGTLCRGCGAGVSFYAELIDGVDVGGGGDGAEAFLYREAFTHYEGLLGGLFAGDVGIEGHYAGEGTGGGVIDLAG